MSDELMSLDDLAAMYKCSRRHARDSLTKLIGFPDIAPGSSSRNPLWLRAEVRAFLHRKQTKRSAGIASADLHA